MKAILEKDGEEENIIVCQEQKYNYIIINLANHGSDITVASFCIIGECLAPLLPRYPTFLFRFLPSSAKFLKQFCHFCTYEGT